MTKLKFRTCKNNTILAGATTHMRSSVRGKKNYSSVALMVIAKCRYSLKRTSRKIIPIRQIIICVIVCSDMFFFLFVCKTVV